MPFPTQDERRRPRRRPPSGLGRDRDRTPSATRGAPRATDPDRSRKRPRPSAWLPLLLAATTTMTIFRVPVASAHGYLKSPRSHNLVAYQDKSWETFLGGNSGEKGDTSSLTAPYPEDCPHCLNRGGTLAQCGILYGTREGEPFERNYDQPLNSWGKPLQPNVQGVYQEGSVIEVEVLVTTHHKGHFEFAACPVEPMQIPTQECFARNKLEFISDELYDAPQDPTYPERAYIIPATKATWSMGDPDEQPVVGAEYRMKFRLPPGLNGDLVLLQWYYLTANSCKHEGYAEYPFPEQWGEDVALYPGLPDCENVPEDGAGVPEQFWNCAEISVVGSSESSKGGQPAPASAPKEEMVAVTAPAPPPPVPPSAVASTHKQCANDSYSFYEATADCTGYIYCMMGIPGEPYPCGDGFLYDQSGQRCNWADQVSCGIDVEEEEEETQHWMPSTPRPTNMPMPPPTMKPNSLLDWDPNVIDRGHDKTIIGYYASWQWYDRDGVAAPANMDFTKITRANFAFFQITTDGDIYGTDSWADPITLFGSFDWMAEEGTVPLYCSWDLPKLGGPDGPVCSAHNYEEGLIYLAHQAGAEVYPSIGGWSLSDPFPAMAASTEARTHFANQCVELIKNYNFDGIDLDWEYPGYEPHSGTSDDKVNFNLLLSDIRAALDALEVETGKFYGLTAALPCGPSIIDNQDIAHVSKLLTELNLMTYDFHGSWNDETGVNAPLYDQEGSPEFSVHGCVANWLEGGATKEKINIGFPFYGRSFLGAKGLYEPHRGNDDSTWHEDEGIPQYYNILKKLSKYTRVRDERTMTQYAYSSKGMVSYDDEQAICDKTEYAQTHGLNGYIIWELSGDLNDDLSTPLLDAANAKLLDPNLNCATLDLSDEIDAMIGEADPNGAAADAEPEIVYYPDLGLEKCLNDGLQSVWLKPSDIYNNAEDCCRKHFHWNDDCVQNSEAAGLSYEIDAMISEAKPNGSAEDAEPEIAYYPDYSLSVCLTDGLQSTSIDTFHNAEVCCHKYFKWNDDCVQNSEAVRATTTTAATATTSTSAAATTTTTSTTTTTTTTTTPKKSTTTATAATTTGSAPSAADIIPQSDVLYYPSDAAQECLSDGKQSEFESIHGTLEECCEKHYGWRIQDCVSNSIAKATATNSAMDTTAADVFAVPINIVPEDANHKKGFFPVFGTGTTLCQNVGTPPLWMSKGDIKDTKASCCRKFAFSWDFNKCLMGSASSSHAFAFASYTLVRPRRGFYPNFRDKSCHNDDNQPSWMGGDYVADSEWECCNNNFHDEEALERCSAIPGRW